MVAFYDLLAQAASSPVIELNPAVVVAMRDGPLAGLQLVDDILSQGNLTDYHLAHAARAIARQEPERRFLEKRLAELG
jgi:RNA polymerase sigma-70 factor, ECF subfamily